MSATISWDRWCNAGFSPCTSISQFHDDGATVALFCARAGVRIAELYDLFSRDRATGGPERRMLWVSRLAVAKGTFDTPQGRTGSIQLLTREYRHQPLRDLVTGLLRHRPDLLSEIDLKDRSLDAHGHNFAGWITVNGPAQRRVRAFLGDSTTAFRTQMETLLDGRRRALLIDSGWQGTTQSLLTAAFADTHWRGLYFGRILTPAHDPTIVPDCIGLLFEAEAWDPERPETAFVRHRHLIECLLEPAAPSIEDVPGGPAGAAVDRMVEDCRTALPDPQTDALYLAARRYVEDNRGQSPARILAAHGAAMPELARMIVRPSAAEVPILAGKGRSADFGKRWSFRWSTDRRSSRRRVGNPGSNARSGPKARSRWNTHPSPQGSIRIAQAVHRAPRRAMPSAVDRTETGVQHTRKAPPRRGDHADQEPASPPSTRSAQRGGADVPGFHLDRRQRRGRSRRCGGYHARDAPIDPRRMMLVSHERKPRDGGSLERR
jgi:hypothetical protein